MKFITNALTMALLFAVGGEQQVGAIRLNQPTSHAQLKLGLHAHLKEYHRLSALVKDDVKEAEKAEGAAEKATAAGKKEAKAAEDKKDQTPEADKAISDADKAKGEKLTKFASKKLQEIFDTLKNLDDGLKIDFDQLAKILQETGIIADFNPKNEEDVADVTKEIEDILNETPEIKKLEEKLGKLKQSGVSLDAILEDMAKVLNTTKMEKAQENSSDSNATDNATAAANATGNATTKTPVAPAEGTPAPAGKTPAKKADGTKPAPKVKKDDSAKAPAAAPPAPAPAPAAAAKAQYSKQ